MMFLGMLFVLGMIAQTNVKTITYWNFESLNLVPSIGQGTLFPIGGVGIDGWDKTGISDGISTPAGFAETTLSKIGAGLQTSLYPAQGTNPMSGGIRMNINTSGYKNLLLSFDVRHGGTSANKIVLKYTTDGGTTWDKAATFTDTKDDTWYLCNFNFNKYPGAENNPNFGIILVTNYDTVQYVPVKLTTPYDPTGAIRFDNIRLRGETLDTPDDTRTSIAEWNFESLSLSPSFGSGTLSLIGGTTALWDKSGVEPGSTIFDQGVSEIGKIEEGVGFQTINYPIQGTNSKSAGIQMNVSTRNFRDIHVSADMRYGNTSANKTVVQYSTDGSNWIDANSFTQNSGDTWYMRYYDLTDITAVNNNTNFSVRFVSSFNPTYYMPTGGIDKIYATTGPVRFDNLVVKGNITSELEKLANNYPFALNSRELNISSNIQADVKIYDLRGFCVQQSTGHYTVNLSVLPSGIYIMLLNGIPYKIIL